MSAGTTLFHQSLAPHYVYLAYSLLRGLPYLDPLPPTGYDLLAHQGRWYVAGSPLPAVLLVPPVAVKGTAVSDIFFGVVIGAVNVTLASRLLAGLGRHEAFARLRDVNIRRWLTVLFAAGTVHWYVSSLGSVWFNAHVVAVMFMLLYGHEVLTNGRSWMVGGWLAMAVLARPTTLFAASFFLVYMFLQRPQRKAFFMRIIPFGSVLAVGLGVLLLFNWVRFGDALDFGYGYVQGAANITEAYAQSGGFSVGFLPCNLYVSLAGLPDVLGRFSPLAIRFCPHLTSTGDLSVTNPWLAPNPLGLSLFLTTPAFFLMFRTRVRSNEVIAAWIGLLSVLIPLWLYHNTGSLQFGYRYILDTAPFWLLLVAAGIQSGFGRLARSLITLSVIINFLGMIWMFKAFTGMNWVSMWVAG